MHQCGRSASDAVQDTPRVSLLQENGETLRQACALDKVQLLATSVSCDSRLYMAITTAGGKRLPTQPLQLKEESKDSYQTQLQCEVPIDCNPSITHIEKRNSSSVVLTFDTHLIK